MTTTIAMKLFMVLGFDFYVLDVTVRAAPQRSKLVQIVCLPYVQPAVNFRSRYVHLIAEYDFCNLSIHNASYAQRRGVLDVPITYLL
jgi:hypothetical protein